MNIALEQTEEYVNGQLKNKYGDAFIRGNNGKYIYLCHVQQMFSSCFNLTRGANGATLFYIIVKFVDLCSIAVHDNECRFYICSLCTAFAIIIIVVVL